MGQAAEVRRHQDDTKAKDETMEVRSYSVARMSGSKF